MANITLLPSTKVPLIYDGELTMTTEWYRFFWNIYGFTGTGVVPVNKGGTGLDTIGDHQIIIGNANNVFEPAILRGFGVSVTYDPGYVNISIGASGVTPGTYGTQAAVGQFTINQYGSITFAQNVNIGIDASQVISGTLAVNKGGTGESSYVNGELLIGNSVGNTLSKSTLTAGTGINIANGAGDITLTNTGVLSVSGTGPVVSSGGSNPAISMAKATSLVDGYLSAADWTIFNNKAPATSGTSILYGNGSGGFSSVTIGSGVSFVGGTLSATGAGGTVTSVSGASPISVATGTTTPVISISQATTSTNGYLSSTDWNTFNNKQPAGAYLISVTVDAPLTGAGTSASHLAIPAASASQNGYLTSTDWTIFNNKSNTNGTVTSVAALTLGTAGTDLSSTVANSTTTPIITLNVPTASAVNRGALSAADWTTFNNKTSNTGTVTSVSATAGTGISVSGSPITSSGTLTITNTAPDQTVVLNNGTGISVTGTYPNFTVTNTAPSSGGTVTSVSGTTGRITSTGGTTPIIDLASGVATAGTTGSSSLIPVVTIDTYGRVTGITTAANPQGTVTSVTGTAPVVSSGGATPAISMAAANTTTNGYLTSTDWNTFNNKTSNTGTVTSVSATVPTGLSIAGSPITTSGTLAITYTAGYAIPTTASQTNWDTAYTERQQWSGTSTNLVAATGRTSLGGTTVGQNFFTLANPTAVTFPRINADNTVSALDAATFRTAIGAGTGSGTVTSASVVSANGFAGTVATATTTPAITLTTSVTGVLKGNGTALSAATAGTDYSAGTSALATGILKSTTTTGALTIAVAGDFPTLNQNTTGTASNVTGTVAIANGGTGKTTATEGLAALKGYATTATAAGTTTLTVSSAYQQFFTGTTTQIVVLPVTTTLTLGWSVDIINNSTGNLTVNSSGGNLVGTVLAGTSANITCILASGTTAASWDFDYNGFAAVTGTGSAVLATSPTLVTPALGTPASGNFSTGTFTWPTFNQNTTGTASNVTGTVAVANGGTGATTAATARTNLGATTVGGNFYTLANPTAITFPRINANNTVSALDAATFRTAIGAGTGSGTVTSVAALTLGTTGTNLSSTVTNGTTTPVITLNVPTASATNRGALSAADWTTFNSKQPAGSYLTAVSVASANGFAGTSSGGLTPALTLSTTITGLLKGNGTAISAATSGVDYAPATSGSSILYGNGAGGFSNVTIGTGLTFTGGTLASTASGGTVTSVAMSVPAFLSVSGSPITSAGTLAVTLSGTALPTTNGGTGLTSFTSGCVLYSTSTSALTTSTGLQFDGATLGVGVTPKVWLGGGWKAQQIGVAMSFADAGNGYNFYGNNIYLDASSVYRYLTTLGAGTYQQGNGTHIWTTAPSGTAGNAVTLTEALRISISGGVSISNTTDPGVGNLRFADTAHGIYFGSSALLSDYEEGTWTPSVTPQGGSLTSYTSTGSYKKVGKIVSVHAKIVINTAGTSTGQMQISNFPYACATGFYPTGNAIEVAIIGGYFSCYINAGGVAGAISSVSWGNGYTYNLSITYETQ